MTISWLLKVRILIDDRRTTTRWTGAAGACFASGLVRRRLNEIAPPGQLLCECQEVRAKEFGFLLLALVIMESVVGAVGNSERFWRRVFHSSQV
jgi:hypothetical protein